MKLDRREFITLVGASMASSSTPLFSDAGGNLDAPAILERNGWRLQVTPGGEIVSFTDGKLELVNRRLGDNRPRLLPEISVHGLDEQKPRSLKLVSGIADAIAMDEAGRVDLVIDWKSDIELIPAASKEHRAQLRQYMKATECHIGAVVYMTLGQVDEVRGLNAGV